MPLGLFLPLMLAATASNQVVTVRTNCYGELSIIRIERNSDKVTRATIEGETSTSHSELSFVYSNSGVHVSYNEGFMDGDRYSVSLLLPSGANDFSGRMISAYDRVTPELEKYIFFTLGDVRRATSGKPITAKAIQDYYSTCGRRK
jgi:hypothetical protein